MAKPPQQLKFGSQATFDPQLFAKFIQFHGLSYRWSRALTCPCRLNDATDQFDPTCDRCGGDGWMYVNPCAASERHVTRDYTSVRLIFSTVTSSQDEAFEGGERAFGEATLTVQSEMRVGYRDRFIGIDQEMAFSELLIRDTSVDSLPVGRSGLSRDAQNTALRYEPVRVNYVESDDGSGTQEIWYEGTHFIVMQRIGDAPRTLKWKTGLGPVDGQLYTIHYDINPVWIVDMDVYAIQNSKGPEAGLKGSAVLQFLPTTFKVRLDFITPERS